MVPEPPAPIPEEETPEETAPDEVVFDAAVSEEDMPAEAEAGEPLTEAEETATETVEAPDEPETVEIPGIGQDADEGIAIPAEVTEPLPDGAEFIAEAAPDAEPKRPAEPDEYTE